MAHTHAGNAGDVLKHVVLYDALRLVADHFKGVRYIDPFAGEGIYRSVDEYTLPREHPHHRATSRFQVRSPEWYAGSPVVGLCALRNAAEAEVFASDEDAAACAHLKHIVQDRVLQGSTWPSEWNGAAISVRQQRFTAAILRAQLLVNASAANVLLLDPTYPSGYEALARDVVHELLSSTANTLLLCWHLRRWNIARVLRDEGVLSGLAVLDQFAVSMAGFGPAGVTLAGTALSAARGWGD